MKQENITYRFTTPVYSGNILYVNVISNYACVNDCAFCSRPRLKSDFGKENIYEKKAQKSLYLSKSPAEKKIISEIEKNLRKDDEEIAFIGLGEPLIYFDKIIKVIKEIKKTYKIKVRIDTNGLVRCKKKNAAKLLKASGLDEIRISLNAISEKDYTTLCRPKYKSAFNNLILFIKECKEQKIDTYVSFVTGFNSSKVSTLEKEKYFDFAQSLGLDEKHVVIREYVPTT